MMVNLPKELEGSIRAEVLDGHFASEDDLVAEAVREYLSRRPPHAVRSPLTEQEFKRQLVAAGLMNGLPTPAAPEARPAAPPVQIEGEPLSETIIRERR